MPVCNYRRADESVSAWDDNCPRCHGYGWCQTCRGNGEKPSAGEVAAVLRCRQCGRTWAIEDDARMLACVTPLGLFPHHSFADPEPDTVDYELPISHVAAWLNVSEPYVIKRIDDGALPYHIVGTERRVRLQDVWTIRERQDAESLAALRELQAQA